jgi:hypothetical protein
MNLWTTIARWDQRYKVIIFAVFFSTYWMGFPFLLSRWGVSYRMISFGYIIMAGLFWGLWVGLIVTAAGLSLGMAFYHIFGYPYIGGILAPVPGLLAVCLRWACTIPF